MIGSPTALADEDLERRLKKASNSSGNGLYVPAGAFWGGEDVRKMDERGTLKALTVTMRKHPKSFKLISPLKERLEKHDGDKELVLYEGSVRGLCPLAPNNVNTMAAAAVAASGLGFDKVKGKLVADPSLSDWHVVEVLAEGPLLSNGRRLIVETVRKNPADPGAVTGTATFNSFLSSLRRAKGKGRGVHLC